MLFRNIYFLGPLETSETSVLIKKIKFCADALGKYIFMIILSLSISVDTSIFRYEVSLFLGLLESLPLSVYNSYFRIY